MDGVENSRMLGPQNRVIDQVSFHCTLPRITERTNDKTVPILSIALLDRMIFWSQALELRQILLNGIWMVLILMSDFDTFLDGIDTFE